jgi:predicted MPP superfamily phosphohydrolase
VLVSALPDVADRLGGVDADLILSGSTHGGQVRLPFFGPLYTSGEMNYVSGRHQVGGSTLIVSKGLGTTEFHARFLADPDILSIRLIP